MPKMPVLVVDDDAEIRSLLREVLELEGFVVLEAATAQDTMALLEREKPCLVTLDIRMGDDNGFQIARDIRAVSNVPIIIVTGQGDVIDRVVGLEIGADDYIPKPFHVRELVARVRAVLRRSRPSTDAETLVFADITMDLLSHRVQRGNRNLHLGPTEFRLLRHLMEHPGRVYSREQLLDAVWGHNVYVESRTVDVHIRRLRKALNVGGERDLIRTVRSAGYALDESGADTAGIDAAN